MVEGVVLLWNLSLSLWQVVLGVVPPNEGMDGRRPEEECEEVSRPAPLYLSTGPLVMVVEARGAPVRAGELLVAGEGCCWAVPWLTPPPLSATVSSADADPHMNGGYRRSETAERLPAPAV